METPLLTKDPKFENAQIIQLTRMVKAILVMIVSIFVVLLAGTIYVSREAAVITEVASQLFETDSSGKIVGPSSKLTTTAAQMIVDGMKIAYLGEQDGSLAKSFQEQVFGQDYGALGKAIVPLMVSIRDAFFKSSDSLNKDIASAADFIGSIAQVVGSFRKIPVEDSSQTAGSGSLAAIRQFLETQGADKNRWAQAGRMCARFTSQLNSITWSGTYKRSDGTTEVWNGTEAINDITDNLDPICQAVLQMQ